ncbi:MAG: hypothetical protein Ct9H300mP8_10640 [Gammaproteobacteria bacterium]|nr:MAG: hypothetical protein Ct9H300mP8_10640 [Gammaproteobacteria bacterium]
MAEPFASHSTQRLYAAIPTKKFGDVIQKRVDAIDPNFAKSRRRATSGAQGMWSSEEELSLLDSNEGYASRLIGSPETIMTRIKSVSRNWCRNASFRYLRRAIPPRRFSPPSNGAQSREPTSTRSNVRIAHQGPNSSPFEGFRPRPIGKQLEECDGARGALRCGLGARVSGSAVLRCCDSWACSPRHQ